MVAELRPKNSLPAVFFLFLLFVLLASTAKADQFGFSFQGPTDSGSGTFITSPFNGPGCSSAPISGQGCYFFQGITGEIDGQTITGRIITGDSSGGLIGGSLQFFAQEGLGILVGTEVCTISQCVPGAGSHFWGFECAAGPQSACGPGGVQLFNFVSYDPRIFAVTSYGSTLESITLNIDPPDPAPEPSTLLLLGVALFGAVVTRKKYQPRLF